MDLGDVTSNYQFALKFEQGLDGSESEFEKYLRNNPNGSVLIADEASNMGGGDRVMKNQLLKKFYGIFDRGTWTSPVTGKTYDLTKHIIQLTGNDGEHWFAGSSADEDRMARWKSVNREETIHEMLIESGFPEALLGRLATVILTKPLLKSELRLISKKLLDRKIAPLEQQYRGLKITYDENTLLSLGESFFSHNKGVRSIRNIVEKRFGSAIQLALLESNLDLNNLENVVLDLKIEDNKLKTPYKPKNAPERNVVLKANIFKMEGTARTPIFKRTSQLTEFAQEQVLQGENEARRTALHEAGHAIANDPMMTGEKVSYITIRGGTSGSGVRKIRYLGYARTTQIDGYLSPDHAMIVGQIANLAAGALAETMSGHTLSGGWSNDLEKIRLLAKRAIIKYGFDKRFLGIQIDEAGNTQLSEAKTKQLEKAMDKLIEQGMDFAKKRLTENWGLVQDVAAELMSKGEINEKRYSVLEKKFMKSGQCRMLYSSL